MYNSTQTTAVIPSPAKLFTPAVTVMLILLVAGFLIAKFASGSIIDLFALNPQGLIHGRIWQLVSYPFISICPTNFIFSCLMLLFLGSAVEREWKTASFLILWLVISVTCGLLWSIVNLITGNNFTGIGASACTYGLMAAIGLLFRGRRFLMLFVAIEVQYMILIFIAIGILMNITMPINLIWVSGALVAYGYIKLRWNMASRKGRVPHMKQDRANVFIDID